MQLLCFLVRCGGGGCGHRTYSPPAYRGWEEVSRRSDSTRPMPGAKSSTVLTVSSINDSDNLT